MTYSVLIVDDEHHARRYLKELLSEDQELIILGEYKNGEEALRFLKNQTPDFLFLDIKMPGTSGMTVAEKIRNKDCQIIFTTAYNQYAVKAFEAEALDYLLKPFTKSRLQKVIQRAKSNIQNYRKLEVNDRILGLLERFARQSKPNVYLQEFVIKVRGLELAIKTSDVLYLQSSSVYVVLITAQKSHLYRSALALLAKQLPPSFSRIHRSVIVNRDHIRSHKYLNNNRFQFQMSNGDILISSKAYKADIASWLG